MTSTHARMNKLAFATLLAVCTSSANAASFAIVEQSVTGLGNAFAAGAAGAEDASTIYYNPAGLHFIKDKGAHAVLGAHIIVGNIHFDDKGSTNVLTQNLNVNNNEGGNGGTTAIVPNFYYSRAINDKWQLGLGVNAPFGLRTDYDDGWVGRYHALESDIKTININPTLAYKVNNDLSLGFGVNIQYIDALLSNAVDFGTICTVAQTIPIAQGGVAPGTCGALGLAPQANDGEAEVTADDISYGFNLGLMWQANNATRIGAAYRSRISHDLKGDIDFSTPAGGASVFAAGANLVDGDAKAAVTLPDSLSLGFQHQVNSKWSVIGDVTWTNWSVLDELRIKFNTGASDNVTTFNYDDAYRYSLGLNYAASQAWTWRFGIALDETPVSGSGNRTPRLPDANRTWVSAGFSYSPSKNMTIDAGYAHLFFADANINLSTSDAENTFRGNLVGDADVKADILNIQARWLF